MEAEALSREERRWCLALGLVLGLATTLPYVWAFLREGAAWRFSGFVFGVEDGNSYLAKMLEGAYGGWLFRTPYTTAAQTGILAFFPYLLLGKLASGVALHEQLIALFHLAPFLFTPLPRCRTGSKGGCLEGWGDAPGERRRRGGVGSCGAGPREHLRKSAFGVLL